MQEEDVEKMYMLYLHDFIRFEHNCNHKDKNSVDKEYKVNIARHHEAGGEPGLY